MTFFNDQNFFAITNTKEQYSHTPHKHTRTQKLCSFSVFVCFFGFCWYIEREEELLGVWVYKYKEMYVCMCVMHWMLQKEGCRLVLAGLR